MIEKTDDVLKKEQTRNLYPDETVINSSTKQDSVILDADVRQNDHKVLDLLGEDKSNYSFKGLIRKLGIHQETLSRALHRLGDLGLVEKSDAGYRLSEKGKMFTRTDTKPRIAYVPLFQTYIPPNVDVSEIVRVLAGKWFKGLRWLGMIEGEMGHMLQWVNENNSFQLNLRIVNNYVTIESNASSDSDKLEAMISAYRIFERVLKHYSNQYGNMSFYSTLSYVKEANN